MTDDATERLIRETLARCVPDEERRKAILTRVRLRELLKDPEVVAAQQVLDSATPDGSTRRLRSPSSGGRSTRFRLRLPSSRHLRRGNG